MKAYICNTGIITAIGNNTQENLASLSAKNHGISMPSILQTNHNLPVGEIKMTNEILAQTYGIPKEWPRTTILSSIAANEAWAPFKNKSKNLRIALLSANTVGGMDKSELAYRDFLEGIEDTNMYDAFSLHECGKSAELTAKHLGLKCFVTTISTACSSSANTLMLASQLIKKDKFDVVIAGGADSLSKFTVNGFNSLMILDSEHCKPYDENRKGLNIGEGAAYLVIANDKAIQQWDIQPLCFISGYANANDAHHQTATSPDGNGNRLAMQKALKKANLTTEQIQYINLHGTGTINNDASEGKAIKDLFKEHVPFASTTKAYTGHTLGAAGAVEAVYSYLSIQEQQTWAQINVSTPIIGLGWNPSETINKIKINNTMSNSFGFGGNCTSIIFSKL